MEGVNNRIKVFKPKTYGFRDTTYFFLKIRAFPRKSVKNIFYGPAQRDAFRPPATVARYPLAHFSC
ncbi:MAG: transposase [Pseudomonadales bacterium]